MGGSLSALKIRLVTYKSVFVVYDSNVEEYARKLASEDRCMAITADEAHKNMDTVLSVCRWLLGKEADRKALLVAVGGGVTTDIAGFAASIYKRGIRYVNVPTTLLAMVDASLGGKTGVNLDGLKNMLGVIREPEFTFICPGTLKTLPQREFRSGAAEMLKTFIIRDNGHYAKALSALQAGACSESLEPLLKAASKTKLKIVGRDLYDKGPRQVLNLGHTYAHAIEWCQRGSSSPQALTHGEAVAIGIIKAARLSEQKGYAQSGLAERLIRDFKSCGLPTELPFSEDDLQEAIRNDKKADGGAVRFVYIREIGKVKTGRL